MGAEVRFALRAGSSCVVLGWTIGIAQAQVTITRQYDALGRLISTSISGGVNDGKNTSTSYDAAGNRTAQATGSGSTPTPTPGTPTPTPAPALVAQNYSLYLPCYTWAHQSLLPGAGGVSPVIVDSITPTVEPPDASQLSQDGDGVSVWVGGGQTTTVFSYSLRDSVGQAAWGQITVASYGFC